MAVRFSGADGVEIACDIAGRWSDPLVLMLHGGGQTRFAWGTTVAALSDSGFLAISMDLRGHGESDWSPDGGYGVDRYAEDVRRIVDQLGRPVALVGASLGGLASILAACEEPTVQCAGLVLVDITPRMKQAGADAIANFMRSNPDGFGSVEDAADAVAAYLPHRPRPRDTSGLRKNLRLGDDGRYYWHWDPRMMEANPRTTPESFAPERFERALLDVDLPMLLVRGMQSEIVGEEDAEAFRKLVPSAEYVDIPEAAHMVAGDKNDAFSDAVISFLERHH
jgi:non-heme chloroperoxidase